jgi:uncharacterized protein (DUF433 family)
MLVQIGPRESRIIYGREMEKLLVAKYPPNTERGEIPAYTPAEVAYWLGIRESTLRTWIYGRAYPTRNGPRFFPPLIDPADSENGFLSFYNLGEAHLLAATRYKYQVPLKAIRRAISHLRATNPTSHPLLSRDFYTDGIDVFTKTVEQTVNLTKQGQLGLKPILDMFLQHIERDDRFRPTKVYPIVPGQANEDKVVSITSGVSSGRPAIDGTGIPVSVIWQRHVAGDDIETLADDFAVPAKKIQRAIEYVQHLKAA